jgi:hypothetical protein
MAVKLTKLGLGKERRELTLHPVFEEGPVAGIVTLDMF